jgi:hypothetical protein
MAPDLVLRDIHMPPPPPWWPPAPGWWMLAAALLLAIATMLWWRWRRRLRRRRIEQLFADALAASNAPAQRIAAMSGLLRRAARTRDPAADRLRGEDWLRFLDGDDARRPFSDGIGRALLDGGFRRNAGDVDIDALQGLVRQRLLDWMAPR